MDTAILIQSMDSVADPGFPEWGADPVGGGAKV